MSLLAALAAAQVALASPAPIRPGLQAFPRIARPRTAAERRVNAALARLDERVRQAVRRCRAEVAAVPGPAQLQWDRTARVTMAGPRFLSIAIEEVVDCGGAYPFQNHAAHVFDLATGRLVDWRTLLPARFAAIGTDEGADGVQSTTLASARLNALYRDGYDAAITAIGNARCAGLPEDGPPGSEQPLLAWLDARAGGLVLQFDWNHAMQACSAPVVIPAQVLRREGASPRLVDALLAARGRRR